MTSPDRYRVEPKTRQEEEEEEEDFVGLLCRLECLER